MDMNPEIAPNDQGPLVMVVEYLESSMCRDLLTKFPDNSAFDFDYSQSSIWSPLIHRKFPSASLNPTNNAREKVLSCGLSRKLVYDDRDKGLTKIKNVTASIKRKFSDALSDNLQKYQKMRKRKRKNSLGFSPQYPSCNLPSTSPTPRKGLVKVLKAASKHFKKKSKKRDSYSQINYFSGCFTETES